MTLTKSDGWEHTPNIAFRHLPWRKDVVNQCLEFGLGEGGWGREGRGAGKGGVGGGGVGAGGVHGD